jgi:hypothetical protein
MEPCYAHRVPYTLNVGPIPVGLDVLHSCDNPLCVNPAHLSPGTYQQNMADRMAKRQGLTLVKSRHRDPRVLDYQGYMLCRGDTSRMATNDAIDDRQFLATG